MKTGFEVLISPYLLHCQVKNPDKLNTSDLLLIWSLEERGVLAFCSLTCSVREGRFPDTIMLGNSGSVVCSILLQVNAQVQPYWCQKKYLQINSPTDMKCMSHIIIIFTILSDQKYSDSVLKLGFGIDETSKFQRGQIRNLTVHSYNFM